MRGCIAGVINVRMHRGRDERGDVYGEGLECGCKGGGMEMRMFTDTEG